MQPPFYLWIHLSYKISKKNTNYRTIIQIELLILKKINIFRKRYSKTLSFMI